MKTNPFQKLLKLVFAGFVMMVSSPMWADYYKLVKNPSELSAGNVILITNGTDGQVKGMGTTTSSSSTYYCKAVDIMISNETISEHGELMEITLEKFNKTKNGYNLKVNGSNYLYAGNVSGNSNNWLRESTKSTVYWSIDINTNTYAATIKDVTSNAGTRNTIYYNDTYTRFSCYQNYGSIYIFKKVSDISLNISAVGYATLYYSDYALTVPANTTATTYKLVNNELTESKIYDEGKIIPAGEPVVIHTTENELTFPIVASSKSPDADNLLKGSDTNTQTEGDNCYFYGLSLNAENEASSVGFYWMTEGGSAFNNGAHKAYLTLPKDTEVKSAITFEDIQTSMQEVRSSPTLTNVPQHFFDIVGHPISQPKHGLYILNGKKIYVK